MHHLWVEDWECFWDFHSLVFARTRWTCFGIGFVKAKKNIFRLWTFTSLFFPIFFKLWFHHWNEATENLKFYPLKRYFFDKNCLWIYFFTQQSLKLHIPLYIFGFSLHSRGHHIEISVIVLDTPVFAQRDKELIFVQKKMNFPYQILLWDFDSMYPLYCFAYLI